MKGNITSILYFCVFLSFNQIITAQDLGLIGKEKKPLKITGGISINQVFYESLGSQTGRDPYTYYLAGNLNFNLYGWSIPFSYTYSNQQSSFQQPFNQYSIHPGYKWIKAHIGYTSMTFSPYTLNGHQFLGAGVELSPGNKFRISAMYGRLQKPVGYDSANTSVQPAYLRMGYGIKGSGNFGKTTLGVMVFQSRDQLGSVEIPSDSLEIFPEENFVVGLNTNTTLFKSLNLYAEYGSSYITRDTRSDEITDHVLYTKRTSSERLDALKIGVKYTIKQHSIGISYERIDPGYRTHGAYYFNNDLENITSNFSTALFNSKLNLGANIGIQRDDLAREKMSSMLRVVNSYNIGFVPVSQLNISAAYSNFKSHTNIKSQFESINQLTPYENLDTLNFTQISENLNLNINYTLSSNEKSRQNLSLNSSFQQASEIQDQVESNSGAKFMGLNLAHNYTLVKTNTSFVTSVNYSRSRSEMLTTNTIGPTMSIRKSFFDNKMRSSISASYNNSYSNSELTNRVFTIRMNAGYLLRKKHNFNLSAANINRTSKNTEGTNKFNEYTVTLGYAYNF